MRTYYSDFIVDKKDTHRNGRVNRKTQHNRFWNYLNIFKKYLSIDFYSTLEKKSGFLHMGRVHSVFNQFPTCDERIIMTMHLWCDDESSVQIEYILTHGENIISRRRASMTMVDNITNMPITLPAWIFVKIGPHVSRYTPEQLAILAPTFPKK